MNSQIRILARQLLHAGLSPLAERDRRVIARVARRMRVKNVNQVFEERLTVGQRMADKVSVKHCVRVVRQRPNRASGTIRIRAAVRLPVCAFVRYNPRRPLG